MQKNGKNDVTAVGWLSDHLHEKELYIRFIVPVFRECLLICIFAFPFGFEGGVRNQIAIVPDHLLSVFLTTKCFIRVARRQLVRLKSQRSQASLILSFFLVSRRAVVSYWRTYMYVHEVVLNRLGCLSLPIKSMVRLTGRPEMALDVYRGQQHNNNNTKDFIAFYH